MAQGSRRRRRSGRRSGSRGLPRGVAMGTLLLAGILALGWFVRSQLMTGRGIGGPHAGQDADQATDAGSRKSAAPAKGNAAKAGAPSAGSTGSPGEPKADHERFEFYDMLPEAKVDVREQPAVRPAAPAPVSEPGIYVIQAGAYPDFAEADKVKARLALLGIVAVIQKAEMNGTTFHRVRIGPIRDLDELNRIRGQLRDRHIDYLLIPVDE